MVFRRNVIFKQTAYTSKLLTFAKTKLTSQLLCNTTVHNVATQANKKCIRN
jgi:hypothetical protein